MKHYVVTCIDLNLPSNPRNITKPYLDNAWRAEGIKELEKQIISHMLYYATESYMHCVIKWLNNPEDRNLSLRVQDNIWFFGEIEI